mgnify:CR=1 FL=1
MHQMLRLIFRAMSLPFFVAAFLLWISTDYVECSAFSLGGSGIFDSGILGIIKNTSSWLLVVLVGTPGALLWVAGNRFVSDADKDEN